MLTKWHSKRKIWCNGQTRFVPNTWPHAHRAESKREVERREERLCHFALPSSTFVGRCSRKLPQCSTTSNIETAMLIVQCASAQCDLCIGTQLCIERSDTAVAGTVRRSAHSSVTVDPRGSAAGTSHHKHHPLSSTITFSHSISRVT